MISVITITYNRKELLEKAVLSVLNQSFGDLEYYVIDDGSTDGTQDLMSGLEDERLHYIYTARSGYLSKLRNIGLDKARGEIIAFLDSDDFWEPEYLQKINSLYQDYKTTAVIANANLINDTETQAVFSKKFRFPAPGHFLEQRLLEDAFVIYPSCFSFRQQQPPLRFNEKLKHGDSDLFIRILALGNSLLIPDRIVQIVKHNSNMSSISGPDPSFIQSYTEEFETLYHLLYSGKISFLLYRRAASRYAYKLANDFLLIKRLREARRNYARAFLYFPLNIKALIKYCYAFVK